MSCLLRILSNVYDSAREQSAAFPRAGAWRAPPHASTPCCSTLRPGSPSAPFIPSKFLSDMFAARLYRLAATKVGVPDYKDLVAQKLKTAEDLYHDMIEQFNQARGFFLEIVVILILLVELVYLFIGKVA